MKKWCLLLLLLGLNNCKKQDPAPHSTPNILFIFTDDQRSDALGIAGNPYLKTPHLDALAKKGVRFENCYVMGGHHGAICAPSRAMLLSGKSLFHVYDRLDGVLTLPHYLGTQGYRTFGTGKWHNGAASFEASFQEGKHILLGGMSNHYEVPCNDLNTDRVFEKKECNSFSTDLFADTAIHFLKRQSIESPDQPFFCYLAFTAPHDPRSPAPDYMQSLAQNKVPLPGNFLPLHPFRFDNFNVRDETLAPWPRTPDVIQSSLAEYYALIRHIDDRVADLIQTLKDTGEYDNTLIIYAADNGLALGSHGLLGKQNLYEHSTKVPLIISGPGIPENEVNNALVYLYDLFPTLTDYLKIPMPEGMDGESLLPLLAGEKKKIRNTLYTAYRNTVRAVRDEEWKLIRYPQIDHTQLFNLIQDPEEINNLAKVSKYKSQLNNMMELLEKEHHDTDDTLNLNPRVIQNKNYDYTTLKQKPDRWQPPYILDKYFNLK
jgi:arylsulfatase A-like enzyme